MVQDPQGDYITLMISDSKMTKHSQAAKQSSTTHQKRMLKTAIAKRGRKDKLSWPSDQQQLRKKGRGSFKFAYSVGRANQPFSKY